MTLYRLMKNILDNFTYLLYRIYKMLQRKKRENDSSLPS